MKQKRGHNKKYIEWIRGLTCMVCAAPSPSDPHHWTKKGHGGMGTKCPDTRCIPLCHKHHHYVHSMGRMTFMHDFGYSEEDIEHLIFVLNIKWEQKNVTHKKV